MFLNHDQLRAKLDPMIRKYGITATSYHAGVHQPHLSAWMNGTRPLSDDALRRVGAALGLEISAGYEVKRKK